MKGFTDNSKKGVYGLVALCLFCLMLVGLLAACSVEPTDKPPACPTPVPTVTVASQNPTFTPTPKPLVTKLPTKAPTSTPIPPQLTSVPTVPEPIPSARPTEIEPLPLPTK